MTHPRWLELKRTVRFGETDAAGVVHFQHFLGWCHQAWEESLEVFGIEACNIFPGGRGSQPSIALPIVHCEADFYAPLQTGDGIALRLQPKRINPSCFELTTEILFDDKKVARGLLRHVAINPSTRSRCKLPDDIDRWLERSCLGQLSSL